MLPLKGAQVWYFWGELRSWELHNVAKKIGKKIYNSLDLLLAALVLFSLDSHRQRLEF